MSTEIDLTRPSVTTSILNFSAPLPRYVLAQVIELVGEVSESHVPINIDLDSVNWQKELEYVVQMAWVHCPNLDVIINPPPNPLAAYVIGATLAKKTQPGWGVPARFMWTKWDNTVTPPVMVLGGISK